LKRPFAIDVPLELKKIGSVKAHEEAERARI
jgi:hypothetical protein